MQETRNNCFGSKKGGTSLLQAKTGKHECQNRTAKYIASYGAIFQSVIQSYFTMPFFGAPLSYIYCCMAKNFRLCLKFLLHLVLIIYLIKFANLITCTDNVPGKIVNFFSLFF